MGSQPIDRALVLHVAKLASLSLTEAEADQFALELAKIATYFEQLDTVDTRDVPPTAHLRLDRMPLREDDVRPGLTRDEAFAQAPSIESNGFAVPTFVE